MNCLAELREDMFELILVNNVLAFASVGCPIAKRCLFSGLNLSLVVVWEITDRSLLEDVCNRISIPWGRVVVAS